MLIEKTNPAGIDISIQRFQKVLYDQLKTKWPVDDSSLNGYGRAYRNKISDGYVPQINVGGVDYSQVLYSDKLKASFFFGVGDTQRYDTGSSTANVFLIMMVDVAAVKPSVTDHEADEEIHVDVEKICSQKRAGFTFTGLETGLDKVFREYSGWRVTDGMKSADTYPKHCFRLNFTVLYSINDC